MAQDDNFQFYDKDGELITLKARFEYGTHVLSVISTDAPHQHIHEEIAFMAGHNAAHGSELANDASLTLLLRVGDYPGHLIRDAACGGDAEAFIQEGVSYTDVGTPLTIFNKNRGSSVSSLMVGASTNPTGVSGGTALPTKFLPGGSGGHSTGGSDGGYDRELPLKANTNYLFTLTNRSGTAQMASDVLEWYEPTNPGT